MCIVYPGTAETAVLQLAQVHLCGPYQSHVMRDPETALGPWDDFHKICLKNSNYNLPCHKM